MNVAGGGTRGQIGVPRDRSICMFISSKPRSCMALNTSTKLSENIGTTPFKVQFGPGQGSVVRVFLSVQVRRTWDPPRSIDGGTHLSSADFCFIGVTQSMGGGIMRSHAFHAGCAFSHFWTFIVIFDCIIIRSLHWNIIAELSASYASYGIARRIAFPWGSFSAFCTRSYMNN